MPYRNYYRPAFQDCSDPYCPYNSWGNGILSPSRFYSPAAHTRLDDSAWIRNWEYVVGQPIQQAAFTPVYAAASKWEIKSQPVATPAKKQAEERPVIRAREKANHAKVLAIVEHAGVNYQDEHGKKFLAQMKTSLFSQEPEWCKVVDDIINGITTSELSDTTSTTDSEGSQPIHPGSFDSRSSSGTVFEYPPEVITFKTKTRVIPIAPKDDAPRQQRISSGTSFGSSQSTDSSTRYQHHSGASLSSTVNSSSSPKPSDDKPAPVPPSYGKPAPVPPSYGKPSPVPPSFGKPAPVPQSFGKPAPVPPSFGKPAPVPQSFGKPAPVIFGGYRSVVLPKSVPAAPIKKSKKTQDVQFIINADTGKVDASSPTKAPIETTKVAKQSKPIESKPARYIGRTDAVVRPYGQSTAAPTHVIVPQPTDAVVAKAKATVKPAEIRPVRPIKTIDTIKEKLHRSGQSTKLLSQEAVEELKQIEFNIINDYLKQNPGLKHGDRISRKKPLQVNGETYKLSHTFYIVNGAEGKPIPLLVNPTKLRDGMPSKLLGKGAFGQVKLVEARDTNGKLHQFALKKSENHGDYKGVKQNVVDSYGNFLYQRIIEDPTYRQDANGSAQEVKINRLFNRDYGHFKAQKFKPNRKDHHGHPLSPNVEVDYHLQPLLPGQEMFSHLQSIQAKPELEKLKIALQIVEQLQNLHNNGQGYAHMDLKPENIMYDPKTGKINVIDFGCSEKMGITFRSIAGTPGYVAPEVMNARCHPTRIAESVDTYSLGVIFKTDMQLLAGKTTADPLSRTILGMNNGHAAYRPSLAKVKTDIEARIQQLEHVAPFTSKFTR